MTRREDDAENSEFVHVVPSDAITEVPEKVLKELGDILAPHDEKSSDQTEAVVLSFPSSHTDDGVDAAGDSSVVVIDDSAHGSTVIIDDDPDDRILIVDNDSLDTQFEQRRERARRREKFKKMRWFLILASAAGIFVVAAALLASPLFAVRQVTIEGNVYTATSTLEEASNMLRGKSIFTLDTDVVAKLIEADPWVADARISKHFLQSVVVEIEERVPVVWYAGADNKARVIDSSGFVIAVLDGWPTKYLQVAGIGPNVDAGKRTDDVYRASAQLVTALPEEIRTKTQGLELSPGGSLSLVLKTGTFIRFGEPTDLQNKLIAVVVLLRRQDPENIRVIDVSTGDPTVEKK